MSPRFRSRRARLATLAVLVPLAVLLPLSACGTPATPNPSGTSTTAAMSNATSSAVVTRGTLSQTTPVSGTLGYAGDTTVLGRTPQGGVPGTLTWLPPLGRVIRQGEVLYRVDGAPVVLLYGSIPAYRRMAQGATAADVTGPDIAELNHALVALGYLPAAATRLDAYAFSWRTRIAVAKLQAHLGVARTGALELGRVVFLPNPARVTGHPATLGGPNDGPILTASTTTREVEVALDAGLQGQVRAGDHVTITLPGNATTPGVVSSVGTVASVPSGSSGSSGSSNSNADANNPTIPVRIRPTRPRDTGRLDRAPVQVMITTRTVRDVLTVPVNALLALANGRYAVELLAAHGSRPLVPVTPGLFDDATGRVEVSGSGLAAGQRVVVPAS